MGWTAGDATFAAQQLSRQLRDSLPEGTRGALAPTAAVEGAVVALDAAGLALGCREVPLSTDDALVESERLLTTLARVEGELGTLLGHVHAALGAISVTDPEASEGVAEVKTLLAETLAQVGLQRTCIHIAGVRLASVILVARRNGVQL